MNHTAYMQLLKHPHDTLSETNRTHLKIDCFFKTSFLLGVASWGPLKNPADII